MLKLYFFSDLLYVSPLLVTIGFHSFDLFVHYPFQQFDMVHHHPNKLFQNHLDHNLGNISHGAWHEMKPLNLLLKIQ
jgi:hypothetical protein